MLNQLFVRYRGVIFTVLAAAGYVAFSGMTGFCPNCRYVTESLGLPNLHAR